ncbi:diguanylate cyclase (GGDEF) domain-containing protein [Gracilibacillus orientalis]|uniref:Diguanylate cyclase (GGDEF) domain-containing protein n=1 Tax=Gracilibacillus orientalis TaxID=334253 RepID=A0A1I4KQ94_9BACI|nr:diguanylate cyclase [Gracilibacillus orientalis]SFL80783.1 diguanylate cyclase (GGDEF) domain-containing protein [Gracilibacillus orientalis]
MQWFEPYPLYISIMAFFILFLSIVLLKKPNNFVRILLSVILILSSLFMISTAIELYIDDFNGMQWLRNIQQIALFLCPVFLFGFAREIAEPNAEKSIKYMTYLGVPSVIGVILLFTNPIHHWMRSSVTTQTVWGLTEISITPTALGIIFISYLLFLTLLAVFTFIRNMHDLPSHLRTSHLLSSIAILLPLLSLCLLSSLSVKIPGQIALSFSMMSVLLIFIFKRYDFNSIWPVSRNKILESLDEGILLFGPKYNLLEINQAGYQLLKRWMPHLQENIIIGQRLDQLFTDRRIMEGVYQHISTSFEWKIELGDEDVYLQVNIVPIGYYGRDIMLVVLTDITEKKLIENRLYTLAHYDSLTNICNRHSFIEKYNAMMENKEISVSFLLMDIDHFKQFNDQYGHIVGDQVLKEFAVALTEFFMSAKYFSIVGRIGGEEFGVLLRKDAGQAGEQANLFQQKLTEHSIFVNGEQQEKITVSIGLTTTYEPISFEKMYKEADKALYQAKRAGRDRVEMINA